MFTQNTVEGLSLDSSTILWYTPAKQASSPLPTPREATEMLERLVRDLSVEGLQKSSGAGHSSFLCFDTTMQLVDKAGKGQEWSWVRTRNVQAFTAQARGGGVRPY